MFTSARFSTIPVSFFLDLKLLLQISNLLFVHLVCFFEDRNLLFEKGIF
jgi:hypothetical protein